MSYRRQQRATALLSNQCNALPCHAVHDSAGQCSAGLYSLLQDSAMQCNAKDQRQVDLAK